MNYYIKPLTIDLIDQCIDILQFHWKDDYEIRKKQFEWKYLQNPNLPGSISAFVAVSNDGEVIGFRGFHILKAEFGGIVKHIAYIADAVVSPDYRRSGIFKALTMYALDYLSKKGYELIVDLGPSWAPYYGNKKLGFIDLSGFDRCFYFNLFHMVGRYLLKHERHSPNVDSLFIHKDIEYHVSSTVPSDVLDQIAKMPIESFIKPIRDSHTLLWKSKNPCANYTFAYSLDNNGYVKSFLWFKSHDNYRFIIGCMYSVEDDDLKRLFRYFKRNRRPAIVEAWSWAVGQKYKSQLSHLGLINSSFATKCFNNPPSLIKTILCEGDEDSWIINGIDIRESNNWHFEKIETDSY